MKLLWRTGPALLLLAPLVGCKDHTAQDNPTQDNPLVGNVVSEALAQAASAQAFGSAAVAQSQPSVTGKVHSAGGELGTWDITLGDCQSGEVKGFYGVDFFVNSDSEMRLRYVHDEAAGDVVKVAVPSKNTMLVFDRGAKCSVLQGSIEKTNFTTWTPQGKIRHLDGHVKFDCTASGGKGHVSGEASFSHCH
jgi:hypothetical protein